MVTTGISVYFLAHFEARGALSFLLEILCSLLRNLKQEWNIDALGKIQ